MDKLSQELVLAAGRQALNKVVGMVADHAAASQDADMQYAVMEMQAKALVVTIFTFMPRIESDAQVKALGQSMLDGIINACNDGMKACLEARDEADRIRESN